MLSIDRFREVDPEQDHYKYWTEPIRKRPSRFKGIKASIKRTKERRAMKLLRRLRQRLRQLNTECISSLKKVVKNVSTS